MAKRTPRKGVGPARLSADRLRTGWPGPSNTRIRLARAQDTAVADALLASAGVRIIPALRSAIEDGTAGSALLAGLGGTTKTFYTAAAHMFVGHNNMAQSMSSLSLTLIAADGQDHPVGTLCVTAPGTVIEKAMNYGYEPMRALTLGVAVAKVHGLAVAETARGQGLAAALLKRAWQVYAQLDYLLLYGSYETERDLGAFYARHGYTVLAPGEGFHLDRLGLPFGIHAGDDQRVFTRWRSRN
ncbi:GNAT family N-acetyltransferase [Streptomyces sp. NPDC059460]|uniref:GNAT family N-acetyltransferase n=1 Tax=Streptomyces sp. NPDC059460 TaxID=3346840 RepID=UPI003686FDA7